MKTLVIHPIDASTDFLFRIYSDIECTLITQNISKSKLCDQIRDHDRIIMLGHGDGNGLFGFDRLIINSELVYLLKEKQTVCIWCYANLFVEKYDLKGFYTGMIISDYYEALYESVNATYQEIDESNLLFAKAIKQAINSDNMLEEAKALYVTENLNRVIDYNSLNLFSR